MLLRAIGSAAPCGYYDIMMYDVQTAESGTVKRSSGRWTRRIYERRTHVGSVRCMGSGSNAGLAIRAARRKVAQMVQRRQNKNAHLYTWYSAGISDTQVPRSVIMSPTTAYCCFLFPAVKRRMMTNAASSTAVRGSSMNTEQRDVRTYQVPGYQVYINSTR